MPNFPPFARARRPRLFRLEPQREWEEAKKRLYEQGQRLAKLLLNHVELDMNGTEIPYKYKSLKLSGRSNYVCALMMVNYEIRQRLGEGHRSRRGRLQNHLDSLVDILPIPRQEAQKSQG